MLIVIPYVLMIVALGISLFRWGKITYYMICGEEIQARVTKMNKSKINVSNSGNMAIPYYRIAYSYDKDGTTYNGKLAKLYRWQEFKSGDKIKVRVLKRNPDKSIGISIKECFTYEHICLLGFVMLFATIMIM